MLRLTALLVATLLTASFAGCLASSEEKERDEGADTPATDAYAGPAEPSTGAHLTTPDPVAPAPIPAPTSAPATTEPQVAIPDGDCVLRVGLLGIGVSVC